MNLHIIQGNSKLGKNVYTINLLSGEDKLIKKDGTVLTTETGTCSGVCSRCKGNCYAIKQQIFRSTKANIRTWEENTILAKKFPEEMFKQLQEFINSKKNVSTIRFHSFGEIPSYKYLLYIIDISEKNPNITFYLYTKRFEWVEKAVKEKGIPDNFIINVSIWHKNYDNKYGLQEFIYDDGTEKELEQIVHCPAVNKQGKSTGVTCSQCKRCFTKQNGKKTAVYAH